MNYGNLDARPHQYVGVVSSPRQTGDENHAPATGSTPIRHDSVFGGEDLGTLAAIKLAKHRKDDFSRESMGASYEASARKVSGHSVEGDEVGNLNAEGTRPKRDCYLGEFKPKTPQKRKNRSSRQE